MKKLSQDEFIKRCKKIHGNDYDYFDVLYIKNNLKVKIICRCHGPFYQLPAHHMRGMGCVECKKVKIGNFHRKSLKTFIRDSLEIHGNKYNYSKFIYKNSDTKGIIICPKHGSFLQSPAGHLKRQGCPRCTHLISKEETDFLNYLDVNNRQKIINGISVDGYDLKTNTIYEFLGDYWHGNPKNKRFSPNSIHPKLKIKYSTLFKKTMKKLEKLKNMGYNVKYIWEKDWKLFKKKIDKFPKIQFI